MTSTPLTAPPPEPSAYISRSAVLAFPFLICVSIFWSQIFLIRAVQDARLDAAIRTMKEIMSQDLTAPSYFVILLPVVLTIVMSGLYVFLLYTLASQEGSRVDKRVDTERLALMELATHQLGAPLASFRWWLEILKSPEAAQMDPKDIYSEVEAAVERMDTIVQALSNAQKVDLKTLSLNMDTLSTLRHLVMDTIQHFKTDLEISGVNVIVDVEEGMPPVRADIVQTGEVLRELLGNAISFSQPKTTIAVVVSTNKQKKCAQVEVRDRGIGIPARDVPRIFEKMFRASNAALKKPVGTGLGLYTAKGIVEKEGGEMWIVSTEKVGTSVFFTLPFARE